MQTLSRPQAEAFCPGSDKGRYAIVSARQARPTVTVAPSDAHFPLIKREAQVQNHQIMSLFYECLMTGDLARIQTILDPDIEIHEPTGLPFGGVYKGFEGLGRLFTAASPYFSPQDITVEAITVGDDRAVGLLQIKLPNRDEPISVAEEATIRNGKIIRVRIYHFDPTAVGS